jgi:hypothetical protein
VRVEREPLARRELDPEVSAEGLVKVREALLALVPQRKARPRGLLGDDDVVSSLAVERDRDRAQKSFL